MTRRPMIIILSIVVILVVSTVVAAMWYATKPQPMEDPAPIPEVEEPLGDEATPQPIFEQHMFDNIKSPHYVSSTPANNTLLTESPTEVNIAFDFDLAGESTITVTRDGENVTRGGSTIAGDARSMRVPIDADKTGNYAVKYTACWPDESCHEGSFGFSVKLEG